MIGTDRGDVALLPFTTLLKEKGPEVGYGAKILRLEPETKPPGVKMPAIELQLWG